MAMPKTFLIDEELANKILDVLDDMPYKTVYQLCDGLMHLKEYVEPVVKQP
jgi:hypothetical protein